MFEIYLCGCDGNYYLVLVWLFCYWISFYGKECWFSFEIGLGVWCGDCGGGELGVVGIWICCMLGEVNGGGYW